MIHHSTSWFTTETTPTMILHFGGALASMLLDISGLSHACDSTENIQPIETIRFVISNYRECSFALKSDVSLRDLHDAGSRSCDILFSFDIQLSSADRITVLSEKDTSGMQNKSILRHTSIASMVNAWRELSGHDFQIPLRMYPYKPSDEDITTYGSLAQIFRGTTSVTHNNLNGTNSSNIVNMRDRVRLNIYAENFRFIFGVIMANWKCLIWLVNSHRLARNWLAKSILNTLWIGNNHHRISRRKKRSCD